MGIPYRQKDINIICIAIDAPQDEINSLAGALGRIEGITAQATYSKV
jgi:putative iron-only hydrogenase system regulator